MNKEFEKIIKKLEEYKYENLVERNSEQMQHCKDVGDCEGIDCVLCVFDKAIEIVKQEAEQYNNRWIPCSERLPGKDEKVYISTKTERVYVGVYTKRYGFEKREGFICDDGFMWMNTALAWKPYVLPAPYQPNGE